MKHRPGSGKHYRINQAVQVCSINTLREREGGRGGEKEKENLNSTET